MQSKEIILNIFSKENERKCSLDSLCFYFRNRNGKWMESSPTWQSSSRSSFTPASTTVNTTSLKSKELTTEKSVEDGDQVFVRNDNFASNVSSPTIHVHDVHICQDFNEILRFYWNFQDIWKFRANNGSHHVMCGGAKTTAGKIQIRIQKQIKIQM